MTDGSAQTRTRRAKLDRTPEEFIAQAPWRFAKTMPEQPHEYTVRGETRDDDFESFVLQIRHRGYKASYRGRDYTYLEMGGHKYWTMGAPVRETTIINRVELIARD